MWTLTHQLRLLLSQTTPGPQVQTPPLIRCTPLRFAVTGWWPHHFLWALVFWPPPAHVAPEPSSAGSLQEEKPEPNMSGQNVTLLL